MKSCFIASRVFTEITNDAVYFSVYPNCRFGRYEDKGYAIWIEYPNGYSVLIVKWKLDRVEKSHGFEEEFWEVFPYWQGKQCYDDYEDDYLNEPYVLKDYDIVRFCNIIRKLTDKDVGTVKPRYSYSDNVEVPYLHLNLEHLELDYYHPNHVY